MAQVGSFATGGGDPRLTNDATDVDGYIEPGLRPQFRKTHDHTVTFEEYHYYSKSTREREEQIFAQRKSGERSGILAVLFPSKNYKHDPNYNDTAADTSNYNNALPDSKRASDGDVDDKAVSRASGGSDSEKNGTAGHLTITDDEWINASRSLRTASWSAVFYLITTDILGPSASPFAIATLGWGPGAALYTVFGALAAYSGWLMWDIFMGLDSDQYPLKTYGDLMFRVFGRPARHGLNLLQTIQLLANVGVIIISNGQSISQVAKFRLCYAICCLIWAIVGFFIGQVRTLQKYGWLANAAVWMNMLVIFISMGVFAHSAPNYAQAQNQSAGADLSGPGGVLVAPVHGVYPAVQHNAGLPDPGDFIGAVTGLMQGVYAYGGAMLFTEFMSEMRRPRDFYKALFCATTFIWFLYMLYGLFSYGYLGQYAFSVSYQGISNYAWQTVCNMLSVISGIIAAGLYGNIGIKVLYNQIFVDWFNAPLLTTRKGKILWIVLVPIYWSIAFIIAAAIPDFFALTALISATCIMQFTYTFPPMMHVGYNIYKNAMRPGEGFDPATGQTIRHDGGLRRIIRGFFSGGTLIVGMNIWHVLYAGGALATAGLGAYSAIENLIAAFKTPQIGAFTCTSPLDPNA